MALPATEVGGDYYDFLSLGRERLGLVLYLAPQPSGHWLILVKEQQGEAARQRSVPTLSDDVEAAVAETCAVVRALLEKRRSRMREPV